ncbi:hypothetical protein [Bowmanella denitrificans]|uniref:hypothetical protein n=1 Tax=Bowmanella denitrificans TaxID=366582 RepID=UPI000C9B5C40|nr:hypothetical protein [Bowmanella denitrificans]
MQTTISLSEEFNYRLYCTEYMLKIDPDQALDDAKFFVWMRISGLLLDSSCTLTILQRDQEATQRRQQGLQAAKTAMGYANDREYYDGLINCLCHAMLAGNQQEASSWAEIILKSNQPDLLENDFFYLPFYKLLSALWLDRAVAWTGHLTAISKMQQRKKTYFPPGTTDALQAIERGDAAAAATAIDLILVWHSQKARKVGSFIHNGSTGFICDTATLLCITALWRGLSLKPLLKQCQDNLKLMPQDLIHRPELSPKCRFVLPVDYVPDYLLAPWNSDSS